MSEKLCTGAGWREDGLYLELRSDSGEKELRRIELGEPFAFRISESPRCIGSRAPGSRSLQPCPDQAVGSSQCAKCFEKALLLPCLRCDGDRCRNPARRKSCVQPLNHGLYLAAFSLTTLKVGVARWERRSQRISEQSARAALVIARSDGQTIRRWEQMIRASGIPDRLQPNEKLRALSASGSTEDLLAELRKSLDSLKLRLPIEWLSDPEQITPEPLGSLTHPRFTHPAEHSELAGVISSIAGELVTVSSDLGEELSFEARALTGYGLEQMKEGESAEGQLALSALLRAGAEVGDSAADDSPQPDPAIETGMIDDIPQPDEVPPDVRALV